VTWRLKVMQRTGESARKVAQTCRHFGHFVSFVSHAWTSAFMTIATRRSSKLSEGLSVKTLSTASFVEIVSVRGVCI
jgi:hypothetical protein